MTEQKKRPYLETDIKEKKVVIKHGDEEEIAEIDFSMLSEAKAIAVYLADFCEELKAGIQEKETEANVYMKQVDVGIEMEIKIEKDRHGLPVLSRGEEETRTMNVKARTVFVID